MKEENASLKAENATLNEKYAQSTTELDQLTHKHHELARQLGKLNKECKLLSEKALIHEKQSGNNAPLVTDYEKLNDDFKLVSLKYKKLKHKVLSSEKTKNEDLVQVRPAYDFLKSPFAIVSDLTIH